ncbi:MAG: hypothetical protein OXB97_10260 [Rhodospirillales bacterium]|nr:hypothetical protein [Rhodospirillales bacterium]
MALGANALARQRLDLSHDVVRVAEALAAPPADRAPGAVRRLQTSVAATMA